MLTEALWVEIHVSESFDSDKFGTFTREKARAGDQRQAAKRKLMAALSQESLDLGVASEWSFWPHPQCPFLPWNTEILLFLDLKNDLEIEALYTTFDTNMAGKYVSSVEKALEFATKIGFPEHGVIVRKSKNDTKSLYKNIRTVQELKDISSKLLSGFFTKKIYLETDMRAHRNPTRRNAILEVSKLLLKNLNSLCPSCSTPGYLVTDIERGLICKRCLQETELPEYEIFSCKKCGFSEKKECRVYWDFADPRYCNYCNP